MRATAFMLPLLLALAACGDKKGETAAQSKGDWPSFEQPVAVAKPEFPPAPRACELVTAADAEALLQQPVSAMADEPENCLWASAGNPGQITMLMVAIVENDDLAMAQQVFGSLTGLQGNLSGMVNQQLGEKTKKSGQELDDLGDEAWRSAANMDLVGTQQIVVRKGQRVFNLNVTGMTKGAGMATGLPARMEALARKVAPQL